MSRTRGELIGIVTASLVAGAAWAWFAGQDANWDWQNYHEYNVWALLNGRYAVDVVPAGLQTYFNPIIYFPAYWLRHDIPAPYGAISLGAVQGLNLSLIYALTRIMLGARASIPALAASVLIAATGAMTLSEVGTSFADVFVSLPIVAGVLLLWRGEQTRRAGHIFLAGLLIGAAVGLKLTNIVFALGAAAVVLISVRPLISLVCLAIGGAIGAALTGGAWGLMLWRDLGNPVFPLFNGVFHSPELADTNILDLTFIPHGFLDGLAYPFYWLLGSDRTAEFGMRDARFIVLALLVPICVVVRLVRRTAIFQRLDWQLLVFFAVSYVVWLVVFSIQRYIVVLELLCGPVIVLVITRLFTRSSDAHIPVGQTNWDVANVTTFIVAIIIALWVQPADWWRRPWSDPYRPAPVAAALQQPALYFMLEKPMAYIAPRFPAASRFYQLADIGLPIIPDGLFDRRIRAALADPPKGGTWVLHVKGHPMRDDLLVRYGLSIDPSRPCQDIDGVYKDVVEACPLAASAISRS